MLPNVGFVSASHDLTLRVWTGDGQVLAELLGHTAIIYAVTALENGTIASGIPLDVCVWSCVCLHLYVCVVMCA